MSVPDLLSRRVLMVTGKGGVGKTTIAVALGLAAAARGKRVILAETSGATQIPALFGVASADYAPVSLAENLSTLSITPEAALEDYVIQQIRFRRLYTLVFRNRIMAPFVDAVPGLHDAVQLGKVFDLERQSLPGGRPQWDLIIVDAPATGHGLTMLGSARAMMEMTRAGPLYEGVKQVEDVLGDPARAGLVLVSLPETMPTRETADLWARLDPRQRAQVRAVVLNSVYPPPPASAARWAAARDLTCQAGPASAEAAMLLDRWLARIAQQAGARARLRDAFSVPLLEATHHLQGPLSLRVLQAMGEQLLLGNTGVGGGASA